MIVLALYAIFNPFFEGNFTAATSGSAALFENPAALGRTLTAENMLVYVRDSLSDRLSLNHIGFGFIKHHSVYTGEAAVSMRPPGVFMFGYALRFNLSGGQSATTHYLGALVRLGTLGTAGFRTDIKDTLHMSGGICVDGLSRYLALVGDGDYETKTTEFDYHWGVQLRLTPSFNCSFQTAQDLSDWHLGVGLGYRYVLLTGTYSAEDKTFGGGILIQIYPE